MASSSGKNAAIAVAIVIATAIVLWSQWWSSPPRSAELAKERRDAGSAPMDRSARAAVPAPRTVIPRRVVAESPDFDAGAPPAVSVSHYLTSAGEPVPLELIDPETGAISGQDLVLVDRVAFDAIQGTLVPRVDFSGCTQAPSTRPQSQLMWVDVYLDVAAADGVITATVNNFGYPDLPLADKVAECLRERVATARAETAAVFEMRVRYPIRVWVPAQSDAH